jgi:predicted outer membrane repeat protein
MRMLISTCAPKPKDPKLLIESLTQELFFCKNQGDSGGGLISTKEHRMVMVGVMSGGVGCGRPNIPGVYTSISRYVK